MLLAALWWCTELTAGPTVHRAHWDYVGRSGTFKPDDGARWQVWGSSRSWSLGLRLVQPQFQPFIPFPISPVFGLFVSCGIRIHMFDLPFQKDVFVLKRREKAGATLGHHTGWMTFAQSSFSLSESPLPLLYFTLQNIDCEWSRPICEGRCSFCI